MKLSTAHNKRHEFIRIVNSIFSQGRIYHLSHDQMLEQLVKRLYERPDYAKVPRYVRNYVWGYLDAKFSQHYTELEWRVNLDDQYIKGCDVPKGRWADVQPGAHFYIGTDSRY